MAAPWDEKSVFLAALSLPPADRAAFLDGACPTPEARERILSLLRTLDEGLTATAPTAPAPTGTELSAADPRRLDEFEIIRRLGHGGMGIVYLALDTLLQRQVAIKVLGAHLTGSEQALGRFRDEAKTAAALKNPGIVPVYKFGFDKDRHYIVSEYVAGSTLKGLIADEADRRSQTQTSGEHRTQWRRRMAQLVSRVAEALEHSHRANVVHRDVKPSNILVGEDDAPRLTDFGIAKHVTPEMTLDFTQGLGSCHYMSPEQAAIEEARVDARSDIFSLGVVLYESLALRKPFDGKTPEEVLHAVRTLEPQQLRAIDPGIPRDLETICTKALEKSPEQRYQSAMHLAADLRSFLENRPIMARPPTIGRRTLRWASARRAPITAAVLVLLLTALGLTAWANSRARAASLGLLSVESEQAGLSVIVQPVDTRTRQILADPALETTTPAHELRLARGQYRVTVLTPDRQSFVEFNAVLLTPGPENHLTLLVQPGDNERPTDATASPAATPSTTAPGRIVRARLLPTSRVVAEDMVQVPAGTYAFGWAEGEDPVISRRDVQVESFFIDRTLVSNRQYKAFLDATGYPWPNPWKKDGYDESLAEHPVVVATQQDADAFAVWSGKRLPTAFEWQAAARGPDRRRFPWGDTLDLRRARPPVGDDLLREQSWEPKDLYALYAKNSFPTRVDDGMGHPLHLLYMFGPVREYTQTLEASLDACLLVGRCWTETPEATDMTRIYSYPTNYFSFKHGFRCVKSASPAGSSQQGSNPGTESST